MKCDTQLNDTFINAAMQFLLQERGSGVYSSLDALFCTDGRMVTSKCKKSCSFLYTSAEAVYFPVHFGGHWTMAIVLPKEARIVHFDSFGDGITSAATKGVVEAFKAWLTARAPASFSGKQWKIEYVRTPRAFTQKDAWSCGLFAVARAAEHMFGQAGSEHVFVLKRDRIAAFRELLQAKLIGKSDEKISDFLFGSQC